MVFQKKEVDGKILLWIILPACNLAHLRKTISQLNPNHGSGNRNVITDKEQPEIPSPYHYSHIKMDDMRAIISLSPPGGGPQYRS